MGMWKVKGCLAPIASCFMQALQFTLFLSPLGKLLLLCVPGWEGEESRVPHLPQHLTGSGPLTLSPVSPLLTSSNGVPTGTNQTMSTKQLHHTLALQHISISSTNKLSREWLHDPKSYGLKHYSATINASQQTSCIGKSHKIDLLLNVIKILQLLKTLHYVESAKY